VSSAATTLVASVTSADASIASNLVFKVFVKSFAVCVATTKSISPVLS
jgi:hypothetical protein